MSGYYTCEVTTEELFETVRAKHLLTVIGKLSVMVKCTASVVEKGNKKHFLVHDALRNLQSGF